MVSEMGRQGRGEHFEAIVIGAGLSGIAAAIGLRWEGVSDLVVLEKAFAIGGTWRDNTYPGCACDVPSALYSYSFAPNPEWTRAFAGQAEIRAYLERVAADHGVNPLVRLGVEVQRARWSEDELRWRVETSAGPMTARVVIAASGPWHEPKIPSLPGLGEFPGEAFHSARWNHEYDLTGRRVAVIGSGASAVQFVPKIAARVARLHLFQRTAQWVLPKPDHFVPLGERWVMRTFPAAQRALRAAEYAAYEALGFGFRHPWALEQLQRLGQRHLRRTVKDPVLCAKLTPRYTLGCKRILMSNSYYRSLVAPNVTVHATGVREVRGRAVIGDDGSSAEVDAIVFGTGFRILYMPIGERVFDAHGRSLAALWKGSPRAYLGTTVSGYPNFFLLLGPSLGTGHSSAFSILEAQLGYVVQAARMVLRGERASLDVRPEVMDAYVAQVQAALTGTVYNSGGCSSYYMDENGINSFSWPWSTTAMKRRLARFDVEAYRSVNRTEVDRDEAFVRA
jgi:cation diffusion facilitator CzcD-associated flavoprotein CzcO